MITAMEYIIFRINGDPILITGWGVVMWNVLLAAIVFRIPR